MALPKHRYSHQPQAADQPRVAGRGDASIPSPVHSLWEIAESNFDVNVSTLSVDSRKAAAEMEIALYPGWVRLALPIVLSISLWTVIVSAIRYFI